MLKETQLFKYISETAIIVSSDNLLETIESLEQINELEELLLKHPDMTTTKKVITRISSACDSTSDDAQKKKLLLDYSSFLNLLTNFYKGGLAQTSDGNTKINRDWFNKSNLHNSFKSSNLLKKYSDDDEQDELCCEPILLFDDEDYIKKVNELKEFPVIIVSSNQDTQIMNEQIEGGYDLTPLLPVLNGVFATVKQLGTQELLQSVIALRTKILYFNGKPFTPKDKLLGRLTPPEGFILLRLAERLTNLKTQGSKVLSAVRQSETDDAQITPEEFEEIKGYLVKVLMQPIKKTTPAVMGPLMGREVIKLESQLYHLSPQNLADDFLQAIEEHAAKLGEAPNRYYQATQQMFNALNAANSAASQIANSNSAISAQQVNGQQAGGQQHTGPQQSMSQQTFLTLQNARSKEAARSAISKITSLIDNGAQPQVVAKALAELGKRFTPRQQ